MSNIRRTYINGKQVDLPVWNGKKVYALYYNGYCVWKNGMDYNFITKWNILSGETLIFPSIENISHMGVINWNDKNKDYEYDSSLSYSHLYQTSANVSIQCDITDIKDKAFVKLVDDENVSKLTYIEIPDTIEIMGEEVFNGCKFLGTVIINGENLTEIKKYTFRDCSALKDLTLPDTIETIGYGAFYNCSQLQNIKSSLSNIKYIDGYAFGYCTRLSVFNFSDNIEYIGAYAFYHCEFLSSRIYISSKVKTIYQSTFGYCRDVVNVSFADNGVEIIEQEAFEGCDDLITLNLGNSLQSIGYSAFGFCDKLQNFIFPDTIREIGVLAFNACRGLTYLEIPNSIEIISQSAFDNCTNLKTIRIHKPVDSIPNAPWGAGDYSSGTSDTVVIWD